MSSQLTDSRRLHFIEQRDPDPTGQSRKCRYRVDVRGTWSKSFAEHRANDKLSRSARPERLRSVARTVRGELTIEDEGGSWWSTESRGEICTRWSPLRESGNSSELRNVKRRADPLLIAPGFGTGTNCVLWSELVPGSGGAPPRSPFQS